jgi:OOP family OmpA-OmpF porin
MKKLALSLAVVVAFGATKSFGGADFVPPVIPVVAVPDPVEISGVYVGVGISRHFFDGFCDCGDIYEDYTYGALLRVGKDFNQYFGVELRAATTWIEDEGARLKYHYGLYAKPQYHITNEINIYALAGYGKSEIGDTVRYSETGFSWGVGLEYDLSQDTKEDGIYNREFDGMGDQEKGWGLFVDYQKLIEKDGAPNMHLITFGVTYDF